MKHKALSLLAIVLVFGLSFSAVRMTIPKRSVKESSYAATESNLDQLTSSTDDAAQSDEPDASAAIGQDEMKTLIAEGKDYTVTASYGDEAGIPETQVHARIRDKD